MATNEVGVFVSYLETISETDRVDYKLKLVDEPDSIQKTVKVFAAMANSGGGLVVYGIDEKAPNHVGIDIDQVKRLNPANLGSILAKYLSPVPTFTTHFQEFKGANYAIVKIEGVTAVPILVSKNIYDGSGKVVTKSGAIFIRSLTRSMEANSENQIRPLLDSIISSQVRRQLAEWSGLFGGLPSKSEVAPEKEVEKLHVHARKYVSFTDAVAIREALYKLPDRAKSLSDSQMKTLIDIRAKYHGLVWPIYSVRSENSGHGKSENGYMAYFNDDRMYFARIQPRILYSASSLLEDEHAQSGSNEAIKYQNAIGIGLTINLITVACVLGWKYLELTGCSEIDLTYTFRNVRGRKLVVEDFNRMGFRNSYVAIDNEVSSHGKLTLGPPEHKVETIRALIIEIFSYFLWTPDNTQLEKDITQTLNGTRIEDHVLGIN